MWVRGVSVCVGVCVCRCRGMCGFCVVWCLVLWFGGVVWLGVCVWCVCVGGGVVVGVGCEGRRRGGVCV